MRNTLIGAAAVFAASIACTPALAAADAKAARFYEDALTRYEKKDVPGAIIQLKNALQIDKSMLPVHVLLGKALLADGDVGAAEVAFNEAMRLGVNRAEVVLPLARAVIGQGRQQHVIEQPRFAPAGLPPGVQLKMLLLRASAYADLGDARNALRTAEEARQLDPQAAEPWMSEVPIRIRARQPKEALAAADKALTLAPGNAEALYLRGSVAHVSGDLNGALAAYDRTLAADPTHTEALVSRAGLLLDFGRFDAARRDVGELGRSSPKDPRGVYLRALLDDREGKTEAARRALAEVTALLDPVPMEYFRFRPQVLMLGGLAHYGLNEREKAKPYLEAVQRQQPHSPVSKLLAQIYLAEKNIDRALESLDAYLRGQPDDAQATLLLASAHFAQGRHARAAQLTGDALKTRDVPAMRAMLGLSLVGSGKFADAVKELESALAKDPDQLQAGMALTTIYLQSAQTTKAVATVQKLAQRQPNNAGVRNLLGMALARSGDTAGARAAFEAASKADPAFRAPQINLARLEAEAGSADAAVARLNAVLKADDKSVEALSEMGLLMERRGQLAEAQRFLAKAADHSSGADLQPALALVEFHLRNNRPDAAREAAQRLTAKAPDSLQVLLALARVALASGDAEAARGGLTRAARTAAYDAPLLLMIATLQVQAGSLPGAAYSLDKALSERPDFLPALALMAEVELRQGEAAKAEARARQIVAKHPKAGVGPALLGDIAASRGQHAAAVEQYRKAHALEPSNESLMRLYHALAQNEAAAALALADQWLKGHPRDAAVRRAVADGHARAGNLPAARAAYEAMLKLAPDDAEVMNNLANVMLLANDPGALKIAEQALAKRPGAPHIIGTTGWAAFKAGQNDRALQLLRDARLRDPNNPDTRYFLGAVLAGIGRHTEAREELQGALRGGRAFASAQEAEKLLATLR
jgi:cellulose synthase operon protein C